MASSCPVRATMTSRQLAVTCALVVVATVTLVVCGVVTQVSQSTGTVLRSLSQHEPFGPEKGVYNFTVVTGLYDIGRDDRSYNTYLIHLVQILKLDVNLIVFIEPKGADFVRRVRKGRENRTIVVESDIADLPCYSDLARVTEIMDSEEFQVENENWRQGKIEATNPLYVVVTNSKAVLLRWALEFSPFLHRSFVWLDAGLGHGRQDILPPDGVWYPRRLLEDPDRITFVSLSPLETFRSTQGRLHKMDTAPMAGGVFSGGAGALTRYYRLHTQAWAEMLNRSAVDDDQTTFTLAYFKDMALFNPVPGSFFGLIKPWT